MKPSLKETNFDLKNDCEKLHKAMKGFGTDESSLINILTKRTWNQRYKICQCYSQMFNKDLIKEIKSEISGKLEKVLIYLLTPPDVLDCQFLHEAIKGIGTNETILIEILCSRNPSQIHMIKNSYQKIFSSNLEKDISGDTRGDLRKILLALCQNGRDNSMVVDANKAKGDAKQLYEAGIAKLGTDEDLFINVFTRSNPSQLGATMDEYQRLTGQDIETTIKNEMSGDFKNAFLTLIECVRYPSSYFAKQLHISMKGIGTNDDDLIRIVVTRAEIDLADIRQDFRRIYNTSLEDFVKNDISGDYKNAIISLIIGN